MAQIKGKQLADASIAFGKLDTAAIITQASGGVSNSNTNDTTFLTSSAIKNYVDAQAAGMSTFTISDDAASPNTQTIADGNTITFAGTANEVEVTVSATDTVTIGLPTDVTIAGNLTVSGTTTTINSTTVEVADKNIELGSVTTPTDSTADAGGITLKGATDKTFNWINATTSWTSSENLDLALSKVYKINNNEVLSANGAALVQSGVAGDGLTHNTGVLLSKGLTVSHHTVDAAITSSNNITSGGANITVASGGANLYVGNIELKVNGITYIQNTDWSLDASNNLVWSTSDFDLESGDVVTLTYHTK
jgi:hypothetical protein